MATKTTCDGTGVEIPEGTPTTGIFGHQYAAKVRPIAEEYLAKVNEMHTAAARRWAEDLAALKATYRERLKSLPDEP